MVDRVPLTLLSGRIKEYPVGDTLVARVLPAALSALHGLTPAADRLPYYTGASTAALATFTAYGRTLVAAADAPAAQTALGLGTLATLSTVGTAQITNNAVDNTKIRDCVALSVIGRSANSTGDPADIAAGTDGHVLRRSGTTLGFGTVPSTSITGLGTMALQNADAVAITGGTFSSSSADPINIDGAAGSTRRLSFKTAGAFRWNVVTDSTAESGSNAGSHFAIYRFSDAGAFLGINVLIDRSTGLVNLYHGASITGTLSVSGDASVLSHTITNGNLRINAVSVNAANRNFAIGQLTALGQCDFKIGASNGSDAVSGSTVFSYSATLVNFNVGIASTTLVTTSSISVGGNIHGGNTTFNTSLGPGNSRLSHIPASPVSVRQEFGTDGSGWQYRIASNNAGTIVDRLTINDNGNVGVGNTAPGNRLTVGDGSADTRIVAIPNNSFAFGMQNGTSFGGWIGAIATDTIGFFNAAGTERARIASGGNVLIGTTTDNGEKFQVNGTSRVSGAASFGNNITVTARVIAGEDSETAHTFSGQLQSNATTQTLTNGYFTLYVISNTLMALSLKGSDGTVRSVNFTLS